MTHAMVITAVHLDGDGKPVRYKVENSWGDAPGEKGWFVMNDGWFEQFVYQVVVPKSLAPKELVGVYEGDERVVLPLWDPMVRNLVRLHAWFGVDDLDAAGCVGVTSNTRSGHWLQSRLHVSGIVLCTSYGFCFGLAHNAVNVGRCTLRRSRALASQASDCDREFCPCLNGVFRGNSVRAYAQ